MILVACAAPADDSCLARRRGPLVSSLAQHWLNASATSSKLRCRLVARSALLFVPPPRPRYTRVVATPPTRQHATLHAAQRNTERERAQKDDDDGPTKTKPQIGTMEALAQALRTFNERHEKLKHTVHTVSARDPLCRSGRFEDDSPPHDTITPAGSGLEVPSPDVGPVRDGLPLRVRAHRRRLVRHAVGDIAKRRGDRR